MQNNECYTERKPNLLNWAFQHFFSRCLALISGGIHLLK